MNKRYYLRLAAIGIVLSGIVGLSLTDKISGSHFEIIKNIEIYTNVYKELNTHYVDELDPGKMMRAGLEAMMASLDPYTNYFAESDIEAYRMRSEGKYKGIGAKLRQHEGRILITEPYAESPAVRAGLKAGDVLLEVGGQSTEGRTVKEIDMLLEGYPESTILLKVQRNEQQILDIPLVRGDIHVPNVSYSGMVGEHTGYIALTTFTRNAGRNVQNALRDLQRTHPNLESVILDLRGNGGGLLNEAVNVVNTFVPKGEMVVSMRGKIQERNRSFKTEGAPVNEDIPVVVLIDNGSASASEIVSGALQDLDRAVLMGQHSYGKGLVQNTMKVGYNSQIKVTTAKYYIPSGRCIQSTEYQDGEPVNIPDEQRAEFRTRGGRVVLDGGGVKPDVILEEPLNEPVVKALMKDMQVFDFATHYYYNQDSVSSPYTFWYNDYDAFLQFVNKNGFDYTSDAERALNEFLETVEEESLRKKVADEAATIRNTLQSSAKSDLQQYKQAVLRHLNKEIVSRYYYQEGRVQNGLQHDPEVQAAIELLNDRSRYEKILTSK